MENADFSVRRLKNVFRGGGISAPSGLFPFVAFLLAFLQFCIKNEIPPLLGRFIVDDFKLFFRLIVDLENKVIFRVNICWWLVLPLE